MFENLRIKEEETIYDFHMNILDLANFFDTLEEKLSDEKCNIPDFSKILLNN
jgi:hypothetical protein